MIAGPGEENPAPQSASKAPSRGDAPHPFSTTRRIFLAILLLGAAATAWWLLHAALSNIETTPQASIVLNPGYQHSQRLSVSTARAAMDALALSSGGSDADRYQMDYSVQRIQIQADSEGLEHWAAHDPSHQGLLRAIHASLSDFLATLDRIPGVTTMSMHTPGASGVTTMAMHTPASHAVPAARATANSAALLTALDRVQEALSNYSASLMEPAHLTPSHSLFAGPLLLWWILVLLLVELAAMAWLIFPASHSTKR